MTTRRSIRGVTTSGRNLQPPSEIDSDPIQISDSDREHPTPTKPVPSARPTPPTNRPKPPKPPQPPQRGKQSRTAAANPVQSTLPAARPASGSEPGKRPVLSSSSSPIVSQPASTSTQPASSNANPASSSNRSSSSAANPNSNSNSTPSAPTPTPNPPSPPDNPPPQKPGRLSTAAAAAAAADSAAATDSAASAAPGGAASSLKRPAKHASSPPRRLTRAARRVEELHASGNAPDPHDTALQRLLVGKPDEDVEKILLEWATDKGRARLLATSSSDASTQKSRKNQAARSKGEDEIVDDDDENMSDADAMEEADSGSTDTNNVKNGEDEEEEEEIEVKPRRRRGRPRRKSAKSFTPTPPTRHRGRVGRPRKLQIEDEDGSEDGNDGGNDDEDDGGGSNTRDDRRGEDAEDVEDDDDDSEDSDADDPDAEIHEVENEEENDDDNDENLSSEAEPVSSGRRPSTRATTKKARAKRVAKRGGTKSQPLPRGLEARLKNRDSIVTGKPAGTRGVKRRAPGRKRGPVKQARTAKIDRPRRRTGRLVKYVEDDEDEEIIDSGNGNHFGESEEDNFAADEDDESGEDQSDQEDDDDASVEIVEDEEEEEEDEEEEEEEEEGRRPSRRAKDTAQRILAARKKKTPASSKQSKRTPKRKSSRRKRTRPNDAFNAKESGNELSLEEQKNRLDFLVNQSAGIAKQMHEALANIQATRPQQGSQGQASVPAGNEQKANAGAAPGGGVEKSTIEEKFAPPTGPGCELQPHQMESVNWLLKLDSRGLNAIIADEMGLGKTVQAVAFLASLVLSGARGPHLVIAPKNVCDHWVKEVGTWYPGEISVVLHAGMQEERLEDLQHTLEEDKFDILVMSFDTALRDLFTKKKSEGLTEENRRTLRSLRKLEFEYLIVDEAHRLKNDQSRINIEVRRYENAQRRLLLTGTPLSNNLKELWCLMNILNPKIFSSKETFNNWFAAPFSDKGKRAIPLTRAEKSVLVDRLHTVLRPFFRRRERKDICPDFTSADEIIIRCPMSSLQRALMHHFQQRSRSGKAGVNNVLMAMRGVSNHPYILSEALTEYGEEEANPKLVANSGKFAFLHYALPRLIESGHRILIFSQFRGVLDLIEHLLEYLDIEFARLDGMTSSEDRLGGIAEFNEEGSTIPVFLLTTRAGGVGLNLQTADTVILFDSDWNPSADLQAVSRIQRIGQKRVVHILRLITENSVDEVMVEVASHKLKTQHVAVRAGQFHRSDVAASDDKVRQRDLEAVLERLEAHNYVVEGSGQVDASEDGAITEAKLKEEEQKRVAEWNRQLLRPGEKEIKEVKLPVIYIDSTKNTGPANIPVFLANDAEVFSATKALKASCTSSAVHVYNETKQSLAETGAYGKKDRAKRACRNVIIDLDLSDFDDESGDDEDDDSGGKKDPNVVIIESSDGDSSDWDTPLIDESTIKVAKTSKAKTVANRLMGNPTVADSSAGATQAETAAAAMEINQTSLVPSQPAVDNGGVQSTTNGTLPTTSPGDQARKKGGIALTKPYPMTNSLMSPQTSPSNLTPKPKRGRPRKQPAMAITPQGRPPVHDSLAEVTEAKMQASRTGTQQRVASAHHAAATRQVRPAVVPRPIKAALPTPLHMQETLLQQQQLQRLQQQQGQAHHHHQAGLAAVGQAPQQVQLQGSPVPLPIGQAPQMVAATPYPTSGMSPAAAPGSYLPMVPYAVSMGAPTTYLPTYQVGQLPLPPMLPPNFDPVSHPSVVGIPQPTPVQHHPTVLTPQSPSPHTSSTPIPASFRNMPLPAVSAMPLPSVPVSNAGVQNPNASPPRNPVRSTEGGTKGSASTDGKAKTATECEVIVIDSRESSPVTTSVTPVTPQSRLSRRRRMMPRQLSGRLKNLPIAPPTPSSSPSNKKANETATPVVTPKPPTADASSAPASSPITATGTAPVTPKQPTPAIAGVGNSAQGATGDIRTSMVQLRGVAEVRADLRDTIEGEQQDETAKDSAGTAIGNAGASNGTGTEVVKAGVTREASARAKEVWEETVVANGMQMLRMVKQGAQKNAPVAAVASGAAPAALGVALAVSPSAAPAAATSAPNKVVRRGGLLASRTGARDPSKSHAHTATRNNLT